MTTIRVHTGSPYDVAIEAGLLEHMAETLAPWLQKQLFVLTDANVYARYQPPLDALRRNREAIPVHVVPPGEGSKSPETLAAVWEAMAQAGLRRDAVLLAFGGGVIGDLGGFAAATYLRGIDFIQWPTTLLSAVDSSVGGKTGINLRAGKNLAGAFHQPRAVFFDPTVLDDLPAKQIENGMAEILKTAVLFDEPLFQRLATEAWPENPADIIADCVRHKAKVVGADETEQGERKLLNLGHTFGHAIERALEYSLPHGYAVSIGLAMMARACARRGICAENIAENIVDALQKHGLPVHTDLSDETLLPYLFIDKKSDASGLTLVVIEDIGRCRLHRVSLEEMPLWLEEGR